jgi:membrane protein YdbS with pleckstrin-like domain
MSTERELRMWRTLGGITVGWLLFVVVAIATNLFGESFNPYYSLIGLLSLWIIGGPLIYLIDIRPYKRSEPQER